MAVAGDAAVGDARCVKELGVDALVALAGALVACEAAFGGSVEKVGVAPEPKRVCPASGNLEYGDILCRLDPVRKLEAGLYHLPGLRLELGPVYPPFDSAPAPLVVELVHPRLREVPGLLPYLVLLAHDRAGEPHERARGREYLDHARPALYLPVRPLLTLLVRNRFQWVGGKSR